MSWLSKDPVRDWRIQGSRFTLWPPPEQGARASQDEQILETDCTESTKGMLRSCTAPGVDLVWKSMGLPN